MGESEMSYWEFRARCPYGVTPDNRQILFNLQAWRRRLEKAA
jgi:hypothetical protein